MQFSQDMQLISENKFDVDRLFRQNSQEYFEQHLQKELDYLEQIKKDEYDQLNENEIHQQINYTLQTSELIQFDYNLIFQNYQSLFKKVKKIKIINNLKIIIFITTIDQIGIYDLQEEHFWLQPTGKDLIEDLDYDEQENIFVLSRRYGKISFGVYQQQQKKIITNPKDDMEGISLNALTHVKFLMSVDLIFVCDNKGIGYLLIRKSKKLRYKQKKIITFEKDRLQNIEVNQLLIQTRKNESKNTEEIIDILLALTNSTKAFLIQIRVLYEKGRLKKIFEEKLLFTQVYDKQEDKKGQDFPILVLMDKNMWSFESYDYLVIIFPNKIIQFFIQIDTDNLQLDVNISFELDIQEPILEAFIGAPEQLVIVDHQFQISYIYLNKLRYKMKITELDQSFFQIKNQLQLSSGDTQFIIGNDVNKKAFCFLSETQFQYFFVFGWKTYIRNLLNLSLNLEAIQLICDLVTENPSELNSIVFLKDVYFVKSSYSSNLQFQQQKLEDYKVQLQKQASDIFYYTINSIQLKEEKAYLLVFFIIKLLVKSENQAILFSDFINFVYRYKIKDEKFLDKFLITLLYFQDKNYGQYYTNDFIQKLFQIFIENQNNKNIRKFIYNIHNKLNLNISQKKTIQEQAYQQSLDMYLFYLTITKPSDLQLFDDLNNKIFEQKNPLYFLKFMIIVYDIFHGQKILKYNMYQQQQSYDIISYKSQIEDYFLEKFEQLILLQYKRVIWMFIEIYNNMYTKLAFPQDDPTMMINGIQQKYSMSIQFLINRDKTFQIQMLPFVFYFSIEQAKFNDLYIEDVLKRVLDNETLSKAQQEIDIYYLFDFIYDLYFEHRDQIRKNKNFQQFLEKNKDDKTIYFIILSDMKNQIEQYIDLYLEKNWFFKVMKKNLKVQTKEDYNNSIQLIKNRVSKIVSNNQKEFVELLSLTKIQDQIDIIKNIDNNDELQYQLIKKIAKNNKNLIQGDNSIFYFSLLCKFEPNKVIDFLEKNIYDIDKVIQICEKTGNKRALGYMKYKLNKIDEAINYYLEQIKYLWEKDDDQSQFQKNFEEIQNLVKDVIHFQLDEVTYTKSLIQILVFISKLPKRENNIKKLVKDIFNSWININFPLLIDLLKQSRRWEHFKHNKYLISELLINMENTTDFNEEKRQIISYKGFTSKENFIDEKKLGLRLQEEPCLLIDKHTTEHKISYKLLYHRCGMMVEKNCLDDQLFQKNICLYCSNIKNQLNKEAQKIIIDRFQSFESANKKQVSKNNLEQVMNIKLSEFNVFEQDTFIKEQTYKKQFLGNKKKETKKQRGLQSIEVKHFFFDL